MGEYRIEHLRRHCRSNGELYSLTSSGIIGSVDHWFERRPFEFQPINELEAAHSLQHLGSRILKISFQSQAQVIPLRALRPSWNNRSQLN
jgi:hypothetical protein